MLLEGFYKVFTRLLDGVSQGFYKAVTRSLLKSLKEAF